MKKFLPPIAISFAGSTIKILFNIPWWVFWPAFTVSAFLIILYREELKTFFCKHIMKLIIYATITMFIAALTWVTLSASTRTQSLRASAFQDLETWAKRPNNRNSDSLRESALAKFTKAGETGIVKVIHLSWMHEKFVNK